LAERKLEDLSSSDGECRVVVDHKEKEALFDRIVQKYIEQ
jgi:hypothetical protein